MKDTTRLIIVGGFLGAGKTTLLFNATQRLMEEGKRVGLVTNDQASELVDTSFLLRTKVDVAEVSGSCFCCNYQGFIDSVYQVKHDATADVIIAEPVGSCTDLSATLMQPLKENYSKDLLLSPLSVLADPVRLSDILNGGTAGLHPSAAYIFKKQLEESDIILISKADLLNENELDGLKQKVEAAYPFATVLAVSSKTGKGLQEWLKLLETNTNAGQRIVEIDYDTYAEGEAVLGWLNGSATLQGKQIDWNIFINDFLKRLAAKIDEKQIGVGHIKLLLENNQEYISGNITGSSKTLSIRGEVAKSNSAQLTINARVEIAHEKLDRLIKETLEVVSGTEIETTIKAWKYLSPGYPKPTHRYKNVFCLGKE
ncbi:GTP-binding protein [Draconibacterium sediminis]|uniref:Cobalamin synthesis protein P47K n=1 Tax=Draconibacterium sediminis TaxID=1544798 RepID=A0A0D8J7J2_9BACT|nr:GTP-binding protein [Draconibacterium sediminis]KJF41763.1 cobalamin synthesis protein P47K [Draconibacterium sediminis]